MKKIIICANPTLFWAYIVVILGVMGGICISMIVLFSTVWRTGSLNGEGQWFFGVLLFLLYISTALVAPRWWIFITLSENGIKYKAAFHKSVVNPYSAYRYIYRGTYWHGSLFGVGYRPQYLVLSQRRLKSDELAQINNVMPSDKVIKIRFSKRLLRKLKDMLPACYYQQIEKAFTVTA